MSQRTYPYLVRPHQSPLPVQTYSNEPIDFVPARRLSDKAALLRPLQDEHLLEVYREAKKMNLSAEFIELLEEAISMRKLEPCREA